MINIADFIVTNKLPDSYIHHIQKWFSPVAKHIALSKKKAGAPLVVGINGAQGSGKSTLAHLLVRIFTEEYQLNAVHFSIDDFYLTQKERRKLADDIHPLLATRGVAGTHDTTLLKQVLTDLINGVSATVIPRFNKAEDDRYPPDKWGFTKGAVDIIVFEGWCLGAEPQGKHELLIPINRLEAEQDPDCYWRRYVNQQLQAIYPELFELIDTWIMLKAPSFDCVFNWRLEQENKLRASISKPSKLMADHDIKRFIQHYQRITEHTLETLPAKVDYLFELDSQREIVNLSWPS